MHEHKIITIKVLPRSSKNEVLKLSDAEYKIKTTAPPVEGAANDRVIELLSNYFSVSKGCIKILRGEKSKKKTIKITCS